MELFTVGVIGDTHGLLRAEALEAIEGSDYIIHTGDVGDGAILPQLEAVAPTFVVRGNVDYGPWAQALPLTRTVEIGQCRLYVLHDLQALQIDPAGNGYHAVLSGHSHRPRIERRNGVLYLNPGSAGPRRFHLPATVARLTVRGTEIEAELVRLLS
ncbi:MAG TPA: metallophosphoesterase family protein [Candidatus Sulfomarinibacteraceae bacterium]|nr:metallophosphoesterase family protein [Candidatus Sulfomarinibacteraceae bacterium]